MLDVLLLNHLNWTPSLELLRQRVIVVLDTFLTTALPVIPKLVHVKILEQDLVLEILQQTTASQILKDGVFAPIAG